MATRRMESDGIRHRYADESLGENAHKLPTRLPRQKERIPLEYLDLLSWQCHSHLQTHRKKIVLKEEPQARRLAVIQ
jgi:hypothetical protein